MTKQEEHDYIIQIRPPDLSIQLKSDDLLFGAPTCLRGGKTTSKEFPYCSDQNSCCLGYIGDRILPSYIRDYVISHHLLRFL